MPWKNNYFETSAEELLAVLSTRWMTLSNIRSTLKTDHKVSDGDLLDSSLYGASMELLAKGLIETSKNAKKRAIYRIKPAGRKSPRVSSNSKIKNT